MRTEPRSGAALAAESVDLDDLEWASAGGSASGGDYEEDSQGFATRRDRAASAVASRS